MPVREKAIDALLRLAGVLPMAFRFGYPLAMSEENYWQAREAADYVYDRMVRGIDWNRVLLEASSRHYGKGKGHVDETGTVEDLCGTCVREALLAVDRDWGIGELKPVPDPVEAPPNWLVTLQAAAHEVAVYGEAQRRKQGGTA